MLTSEDFKYTIKDIYKENKDNNRKMLSDYNSDFWEGYRANNQYFDRRFMTLYASWFPFIQVPEEGIESVADDFRYDVYSHLLANDKRYNELYRINVIPDNEAYSPVNNVDYTETYTEESHNGREFNKGAQTDGASGFTTYGSIQDSESKSKVNGQQSNGETISRTYGARSSADERKVSAFNESSYSPAEKNEHTEATYTDGENNTYTLGSHTDTENNTITRGSHRDDSSNTRTEGARKDTTDDDGTKEYTLHKVGNMGVMTVDDILEKRKAFWSLFDFYGFIFEEIARDLLRGA